MSKAKAEKTTLSTADVAKALKIEPKRLRALLRSAGKGAKGERYSFTDADIPALKKLLEKE